MSIRTPIGNVSKGYAGLGSGYIIKKIYSPQGVVWLDSPSQTYTWEKWDIYKYFDVATEDTPLPGQTYVEVLPAKQYAVGLYGLDYTFDHSTGMFNMEVTTSAASSYVHAGCGTTTDTYVAKGSYLNTSEFVNSTTGNDGFIYADGNIYCTGTYSATVTRYFGNATAYNPGLNEYTSVTSTNPSAYPDNGSPDGMYWYLKQTGKTWTRWNKYTVVGGAIEYGEAMDFEFSGTAVAVTSIGKMLGRLMSAYLFNYAIYDNYTISGNTVEPSGNLHDDAATMFTSGGAVASGYNYLKLEEDFTWSRGTTFTISLPAGMYKVTEPARTTTGVTWRFVPMTVTSVRGLLVGFEASEDPSSFPDEGEYNGWWYSKLY